MSEAPAGDEDGALEELLEHLREARGFDFTGYKRASLTRRVHRRMADVGASTVRDYQDRLEVDPDEFTALFNTVLINVTSFFRDPEAWERLSTDLLPTLLEARPSGPLRVWSAGCASGQEAYTAAVVLAELLGEEAFRERVKIYATDVDEEALAHARTAAYSSREVAGMPSSLLEKYFEPTGSRWTFRPELRRAVIFGRADLVQDAPISQIDLLLCRNTLMYLTAETQARIAERLHYSLAADGLMVLGKAEMLLSHSSLFAPVDLKNRIFRRVGGARVPARFTTAAPVSGVLPSSRSDAALLRAQAVAASPLAQLLLDREGRIALSNQRADATFGTSASDLGRPFQDLELSYRPVELRSALEEAHTTRRPVWIRDVEWTRGREEQWFDVQVAPLQEPAGQVLGTSVVFFDVTRSRRLQQELEVAHGHLETAYEELESTNEELETTNEELQSTVEELETTNEELHSTNEELETMNEELQSMNDELQYSNQELRLRTEEVAVLNRYMGGVFAGLDVGVAVVDPDLRVQVWNDRAADLWGVRADEVSGQPLRSLDIGLPLSSVLPSVAAVLAGREADQLVVPAVNRRGRRVAVGVRVSAIHSDDGALVGAVVVMDAHPDGGGPAGGPATGGPAA